MVPTAQFAWFCFYASYGDTATVLSRMVSRLGFRLTHRGLELQAPELERAQAVPRAGVAKADGTLALSDDPTLVMRFLGLSPTAWAAGFATREQLFRWFATCRLLHEGAMWPATTGKAHRTARDRPLYAYFFTEWLPTHRADMAADEPDGDAAQATVDALRARYAAEATAFFEQTEAYRALRQRLTNIILDGASPPPSSCIPFPPHTPQERLRSSSDRLLRGTAGSRMGGS